MSASFSDAVVLVAGATGALGHAVVRAFASEGGKVIATYRAEQDLKELTDALGASARQLDGLQLDLADAAATLDAVNAVVKRHGRIDALVNTVGAYAGGSPVWELESLTLERMLDLNLRCTHHLLRAVVPVMLRQQRGCIVNVAAKAALTRPPRAAAYAASKAAALAMMGCLSTELTGTGVRANSVLPATIDTEANRRAMPQADFSKWTAPAQIADVILFLCSPQAQALHGAELAV